MPDIRHRVEVKAPAEKVYQAVATKEGLSAWWTRDGVRGTRPRAGSSSSTSVPPIRPRAMEVTELDTDAQVSWRCVEGESEWVGTNLSFTLTPKEGRTVVLFTHADWRSPSEFMAHCSVWWAYFLLSLKALAETGSGTPFPEDLKF